MMFLSECCFSSKSEENFSDHCNSNPNQDGGEQKILPTSFYMVTSTNIGISPQNFLTFSFNPFAGVKFQAYT